ncbi:MAG TPA: hypothetical protein VGW57_09480 [Chthoniobacterales bacterium]|nr:hypothetical protein [Chthoniobacterales bacterium]
MHTDIIGVTVGVVGILIGVAVAYYFYRIGLRVKEPCFSMRSNNLIEGYSSRLTGLKVLFGDEGVETLTVTRLLFWNAGAETIDRNDIAPTNPLRIEADTVSLLEARVLSRSSDSNSFSCSVPEEKKRSLLTFDYLDRDQGAVIQVVHTGTSSSDLRVLGDIKGAPKLTSRTIDVFRLVLLPTSETFDRKLQPSTRRKVNAVVLFLVGIIALCWAGFLFNSMIVLHSNGILFLLFSLLMAGTAMLGGRAFLMGFRFWRRGSPRGLELFEQDF